MTYGEIFSLISIIIAFTSFIVSLIVMSKKASKDSAKEKEALNTNMHEVKYAVQSIQAEIVDIKSNIQSIDEKFSKDHDKLVEHNTRLTNLEKEVFSRKR